MSNFIHTDTFLKQLGHTKHDAGVKYCFILGSGCSVENGIPTGWNLARKWFNELGSIYLQAEIDAWEKRYHINKNDLGFHYSQIFEFRFALSPGSGYNAISHEIEKGRTGFGHIILAQLLVKSRHNVVITTNFDTLIEETIYAFTEARPVICGHESIAKYAKPSDERPLILKIHRDRFMDPFNMENDIAVLQPEWAGILNKVFSDYIPVVIGYGGNDGSLMNYLKTACSCKTLYWCTNSDKPLREDIIEVINHHNGNIVRIESFNRLMLRFMNLYHIYPVDKILKEKFKNQSERFVNELLTINENIQEEGLLQEKLDAKAVINTFDQSDWWKWKMRVQEAVTPRQKIDLYNEALTFLPYSADLNFHYGRFLNDLGKFEESLPFLQKATQLRENFYDAWINMGVAYRNVTDYDRSVECYEKALEIQPRYYRAWGNLGFAFHSKGEYKKAIDAYQKSIAANPKTAYVWNNLGFSYKAIDLFDEAINAFQKAIELQPDLAMPYFNLGNIFVDKDNRAAIVYFRKAVECNPELADAFYNIGLVYEDMNQLKEAKESFKRARQINPNDLDYKAAFDRIP